MPQTCSRCRRELADSADPPMFCMYCGYRLRTAGSSEVPLLDGHATRSIVESASTEPEMPAAADAPPASVAGYRFLRHLGTGGMGTVYEAEATASGQRVAVKLLAGRLADNPASVERFRQEGRLASQITHPRCVFVLRADTDSGRPYIVMELMPGRTLKDLVEECGPMPPDKAILRVLDAIDGLIEAHRLGVIHRDVKPSNCFLTEDDRVKIGDFGLSKSLGGDLPEGHKTHSGTFLGTVLFAPPEQIRGEPVGYDSDVYSVCATLYYLLCGRAPHEHVSLTAALAKAISETPPPLCATCPAVSAELERIVLKGLERDRDRRYPSLEELREELQQQLPAFQVPAPPRLLFLAHLVDFCIVQVLTFLFEMARFRAFGPPPHNPRAWDVSWPQFVVAVLYWGLMEGRTGRTLGKRLLRLRVCRPGDTGPPGVARGLLRAVVFHAVWLLMADLPGLAALVVHGLTLRGVVLGIWIGGVALFSRQWKKSAYGFRGLHDFAAGTRVVQRPRPPARIKLVSRFPNPLDRAMPTPVPLPATVGGFVVRGKVCETAGGGDVWVAEDTSLGRRVVVRVEPPGVGDDSAFDEPAVRPTRLRAVGHGTIEWNGAERAWMAAVAPAGFPLPDVVATHGPLGWAETRPLLEQLAAELAEGEADGTLPHALVPEQLWVEPGGRLQLLDFPMATGRALAAGETKSKVPPGTPEPMRLVRQVATAMLEGAARDAGGRVAAPLPPHASAVTDRLFGEAGGYETLDDLRGDLAANHAHPPKATARLRAAHLTLQAMMLAVGLVLMFLAAEMRPFAVSLAADEYVREVDDRRALLADPVARARLRDRAGAELPPDSPSRQVLAHGLGEPYSDAALARLAAAAHADAGDARENLNWAERAILVRVARYWRDDPPRADDADLPKLAGTLAAAVYAGRSPRPDDDLPFAEVVAVVLGWPLVVWAAFAFAFRGGLAFALSGLTLVRADGRPAERWRCVVREWLAWLPLAAVLVSAAYLEWAAPARVFARTGLGLVGLALLPVYAALALRTPARGPHDQVAGTFVVPR